MEWDCYYLNKNLLYEYLPPPPLLLLPLH